jgi:8-amino-7-oxononanoate synthase
MDLFRKCREFTAARDAKADRFYPYYLTLEDHDGATVSHGRELIMCGSNNYLGLTSDPRVRRAAAEALQRYGSSCTGSRLLNGNLRLHEDLEAELADFFGKPAALVFSTGYQTNVGTIAGLLARDDFVLIDRDAHASIIDGAKLSRGAQKWFAHNDTADLERQLADCPPGAGKLVVVDGVYSMEGDIAPVPEILAVCRRHGARLVVDDAHGAGVLAGGHGTCARFGVTDEVDLITLTFSKSFASLGGAVLGDEDIIHYLRYHARSLIFSASLAPANAAAALAALRIVRDEPWRAHRVMANGTRMRTALSSLGYDVGGSQTPIVPINMDDLPSMLQLWQRLLDAGVYTNPVQPPAASIGLRTSYMATHEVAHLDRVVSAFAAARDHEHPGTDLRVAA